MANPRIDRKRLNLTLGIDTFLTPYLKSKAYSEFP